MNTIFIMGQQFVLAAKAADDILGFIRQSIARKSRKRILPLYSTLVRTHPQCCARSGLPHTRET